MGCDNCPHSTEDGKITLDIWKYCRECDKKQGVKLGRRGWGRMEKYGGGFSIDTICGYEVDECEEILSKYNVPHDEVVEITDMIREAYYQLQEAFKNGRRVEAYVVDEYGDKAFEHYFRILRGTRDAGDWLLKELQKEAVDE